MFSPVNLGSAPHSFVVVDSFSKYVDAQWLPSLTTASLITYLGQLFRHFGRPDTIVSDNGGQFVSADFAQFCAPDIVHLRCAPYMPMRLAERMVRTIKSALESRTESLDSIVTAYNYTPNATINGDTPSKRFFGRELKTPFDIYKPKPEAAETTDYQRAFKEHYDDKNGARERSFAVGEEVTVELANKRRVPAKVVVFREKP